MAEPCTVEVVERYQDSSGQTRARWRRMAPAPDLTAKEATELAAQLRDAHGGARVACQAFEVVALRQYLALKLIEPAELPPVDAGWADPMESRLASFEGR